MTHPTAAHGRVCILIAAVLWSLSGAFTKALTTDTFLGLNVPRIDTIRVAERDVPVQLACYRMLFAGLVLVPTLRPRDIQFRPMMFAMLLSFTLMNAAFVSAMALGTAANAILLQYSAPLWLYLVSILWLRQPADRRGTISTFVGVAGVAVIIAGGWSGGELAIIALGLFAGVTYAAVVLSLRQMRDLSSGWLTVWNHLLGGLLLVPFVVMLNPPSWQQFVVLFFFGAVQMGFPYWLMARGLRSVSAHEAGTLTLLEPILNPLWTYLVANEVPEPWTYVGGAVILGALAYRYWPRQETQAPG